MRAGKHLLLLVLSLAATGTSAQMTSGVEVTVVDADSGQAIQGAKVMLYEGEALLPDTRLNDLVDSEFSLPDGPRSSRAPKRPSRGGETDGSGKSAFQGVSPGPYRLDADASGYISQRRQLSGMFDGGVLVNVSVGEKNRVVLRLERAGAVSGSVKDTSNRLIAGLSVYLLRPGFASSGERTLSVVAAATTDSAGRFEVDGLKPGRYSIAAGPRGTFAFAPRRPSGESQAYAFTYYPGVPDPALAVFIDVGPGTHFGNIGLTVKPQKLFRVRGRIDFGNQLPREPGFSLYALTPFQMYGANRRQQLQSAAISTNGRFELNDLPSGTYSLGVIANRRGQMPLSPPNTAVDDAYFTINVKESNIDDLEFRMSDATSIHGRVSVADGSPLNAIRTVIGRLPLRLDSTNQLQPGGSALIDVNDGSFSLKGIVGTYRVSMQLDRKSVV